jgi:hypothetical protein
MYTTCFGLFLGHPQACQYKIKKILEKYKEPLITAIIFITLKYKT